MDAGDTVMPQSQSIPQGALPPDAFDNDPLSKYPPNIQSLAQQLKDYKIPLPSGYALSKPVWQQAMQAAGEIDPDWNAAAYPNRMALRKSYMSGTDSQNLASLNTAIHHLATLKQNADGLHNRAIPAWNTIANWAETGIGDPRVNRFNQSATAVSEELAKAFRGSSGTEGDIKNWRESLDANGSPDQLNAGVDGAIQLLQGRVQAMRDKYKNGMGREADFQFLTPQSRAILKGMKYDPDKIEGVTPQTQGQPQSAPPAMPKQQFQPQPKAAPSVPKVSTQADFDKLPSGAMYIEDDGNQYRKP